MFIKKQNNSSNNKTNLKRNPQTAQVDIQVGFVGIIYFFFFLLQEKENAL